MRTRRLPTSGLAALAVVLAALAVVVVAGAPTTTSRGRTATQPTTASTTNMTTPTQPVDRDSAATSTSSPASTDPGDGRQVAIAPPTSTTTSSPTSAATSSTSSTTSPSTTNTTTTTTTTTEPVNTTTTSSPTHPAHPTIQFGTFDGGVTSATEHFGAVRAVAVSVPAGIRVSLTVTCGLAQKSKTAVSTARVRIQSSGASCVAIFSVPPTSPQPAQWRLVAS